MSLRDISLDDLWLFESMHCDPAMMSQLGGPLPREGEADKLRRNVAEVEAGTLWYFVIATAEGAAGTICVWRRDWRGEPIQEIGWMVLPRFQGRGLAKRAVRTVLDRARDQEEWAAIHAFPAVTNAPSNGICRRTGFTRIGEVDYAFRDRLLRCNHWRFDLSPARPAMKGRFARQ